MAPAGQFIEQFKGVGHRASSSLVSPLVSDIFYLWKCMFEPLDQVHIWQVPLQLNNIDNL